MKILARRKEIEEQGEPTMVCQCGIQNLRMKVIFSFLGVEPTFF